MALRLPRDISGDDRYTAWVGVVERIYTEHVNQGWRHRVFRLMRGVFVTNERLSEQAGFLFEWMIENYVDAALMVVRRELDIQAGTENLRNLLDDIASHADVLCRERYVAAWGPHEGPRANRAFDSFAPVRIAGSPNADHIDPVVVRADLDRLTTAAEDLRVYAERTRAHRTPNQGVERQFTFRELHQTIAATRDVVGKYYTLLTLNIVAEWEPVPQYNTIEAFEQPWVTDRDAVRRASARDSDAP